MLCYVFNRTKYAILLLSVNQEPRKGRGTCRQGTWRRAQETQRILARCLYRAGYENKKKIAAQWAESRNSEDNGTYF